MPCIHAEWAILGGRVRNARLSVISGHTLLTVACEYCRRAPSDFVFHTGLATRQPPCSITRDIKFFVAHTVNYVICNNHTIIDFVLLNFTRVSYSTELSPTGPKVWEMILRSWQVELSTSVVRIQNQPIQKRFWFWYRKLCAFNLLSWGPNDVLGYLTSSDFCVA